MMMLSRRTLAKTETRSGRMTSRSNNRTKAVSAERLNPSFGSLTKFAGTLLFQRKVSESMLFRRTMPNNSLKELYVEELKDLYSAENQLVRVLPKMAKVALSDELRRGFEEHLEQTKGHVQRLEKVFQALEENPKGKKCKGMEGLLEEGAEVREEDFEGSLMDAALIGAAQRVEHYEIAAYGTASEFAKLLGESEHVTLLEETLQEEKETDEKLTELAKEINPQANEGARESEARKVTSKRSRRAA